MIVNSRVWLCITAFEVNEVMSYYFQMPVPIPNLTTLNSAEAGKEESAIERKRGSEEVGKSVSGQERKSNRTEAQKHP